MGTAIASNRRVRSRGVIALAAIAGLSAACPKQPAPAPKEPALAEPAKDAGSDTPWSLGCREDGTGYIVQKGGRAIVQVMRPKSDVDKPYLVCIVPATTNEARCEPLSRREWLVDVQAGDLLALTTDPADETFAPPAGLRARLCPSEKSFHSAEWSSDDTSNRDPAKRPPAEVEIWVEVGS